MQKLRTAWAGEPGLGRRREGEGSSEHVATVEAGLTLATGGLNPTDGLLDALKDLLAHALAGMTGVRIPMDERPPLVLAEQTPLAARKTGPSGAKAETSIPSRKLLPECGHHAALPRMWCTVTNRRFCARLEMRRTLVTVRRPPSGSHLSATRGRGAMSGERTAAQSPRRFRQSG